MTFFFHFAESLRIIVVLALATWSEVLKNMKPMFTLNDVQLLDGPVSMLVDLISMSVIWQGSSVKPFLSDEQFIIGLILAPGVIVRITLHEDI